MRIIFRYTILILIAAACGDRKTSIIHGDLVLEFDDNMRTMVSSKGKLSAPLMNEFISTECLITSEDTLTNFQLGKASSESFGDAIGKGKRWVVHGITNSKAVEKIVTVSLYDTFPDMAFFDVSYVNHSGRSLEIRGWMNHRYKLKPANDTVPFWSFQGESTGARKDWIFPLRGGFHQRNFMGMNNSDYGGGIPVVDLWRPDIGVAVGHSDVLPRLVSLPVSLDDAAHAEIGIVKEYSPAHILLKGDTLKTLPTFVLLHHGDYYAALTRYARVLAAKGIVFPEPEGESFKPNWCAWGYMRDFTLDEINGTIPKVKELGIGWVTIDDGYQQAEGDWHVTKKKFPKGDEQMKAFVRGLHSKGMKVMLWWAPLAADPDSKLLVGSPDLKILDKEGKPQNISWWDAYYMSPVYEKTLSHTKEILELFLRDWDIDGLKMDGQHLNAVPPDYNPEHRLQHAETSYEHLPEFYRMIQTEAQKIKPHVVIQNCPCGTCMSVFNMPYMNQAVASDPLNSWQIRLKGKTYKALIPRTAYFGDHVELSDGRQDFASAFGIGAVPGTKFTWPKENPSVKENNLLTPEKEIAWKKWLSLYQQKMLSTGLYRGELYDIGYDKPETHVVQKGDTLNFAFYNASWIGPVEFRGLKSGKYKVYDYVNDKDLGEISADNPIMNFAFKGNLLVEVYPSGN